MSGSSAGGLGPAVPFGASSGALPPPGYLSLPFPPGGDTYRGGGFDDAHRDFFTVGKQYRVPGFLATSFSKAKAEEFQRRAEKPTSPGGPRRQSVLWTVHVDPEGETDAA